MVLYQPTIQTLCLMTTQQMIMNCIKLFVTILKLIILKKWTLYLTEKQVRT